MNKQAKGSGEKRNIRLLPFPLDDQEDPKRGQIMELIILVFVSTNIMTLAFMFGSFASKQLKFNRAMLTRLTEIRDFVKEDTQKEPEEHEMPAHKN